MLWGIAFDFPKLRNPRKLEFISSASLRTSHDTKALNYKYTINNKMK